MIDPITRLRVGGSVDVSMLTRIIESVNNKVDKLELQVKLLMDEKETKNDRKPEVSDNRRKTNKDS